MMAMMMAMMITTMMEKTIIMTMMTTMMMAMMMTMMERTMMMAIAGKLCAGEQSRRRRDGGEPSLGLQRTGALPSL